MKKEKIERKREKERKLMKSRHKLIANKHLQGNIIFKKQKKDPENTSPSKLSICPSLPKP